MAIKADTLLVKSGQSIYEAVRVIDANHRCMAIIVNEANELIGIVTDADVRRAIIRGVDIHTIVDGVMQKDPFIVCEPLDHDHVIKLIQKSRFKEMSPEYVPSVDDNLRPVNLYHISELISVNILRNFTGLREKPTRILLIGGAGYIGSILTRELLDDGYRVTIIDKFLYGRYSIKEIMHHPDLEIVEGDTRHIDILVPAIKEASAVVHLAELVGDPLCEIDPEITYEINYLATATIARICSDLQVNRYIYISSCSVYGSSVNPDDILDENSTLAPVSLYAKMKINAERAILGTANENFSPCILRLGTVFGASHRPRFDLVVNLLAAKAVAEKKIKIFGGNQWRPHVHVSDVAKAIKLALESPVETVKNKVFNLVGENLKIIDVGRLVADLIPGTEMLVEDDAEDARDYRVGAQRAMEDLGFRPLKRVEDGILEVAEMLRSGRVKNFSDPKYHNYRSQFLGSDL